VFSGTFQQILFDVFRDMPDLMRISTIFFNNIDYPNSRLTILLSKLGIEYNIA